jgi:hypothetical protein
MEIEGPTFHCQASSEILVSGQSLRFENLKVIKERDLKEEF